MRRWIPEYRKNRHFVICNFRLWISEVFSRIEFSVHWWIERRVQFSCHFAFCITLPVFVKYFQSRRRREKSIRRTRPDVGRKLKTISTLNQPWMRSERLRYESYTRNSNSDFSKNNHIIYTVLNVPCFVDFFPFSKQNFASLNKFRHSWS